MKQFKCLIVFLYLVAIIPIVSFAQTTYINGGSIGDGKESARLYSIEIVNGGIIATIELTALKATRRLNCWCSTNCHISSNNIRFATIRGYYIDGEIKPCGVNEKWGWSNVPAGGKYYYKLYFEGSIPPGLTNISLVDEGTYEWNGYSNNLVHSYGFRNITINNPRKDYTQYTSEYSIKQHIDANNDGICGIYEQIGGRSNYKLACVKHNGEYALVYMSCTNGFSWWKFGDIKAYLHQSASGIFKADWLMSDKSINKDTYIAFDGLSMVSNRPTGADPGERKYLKMYPGNSSPVTKAGKEWTGTGFALKDGYVVTNNHVVDGAKSIIILGVNGNTSTEYTAHVVGVDKNNDLALIKIDDYRFKGFTNIPYAVPNTSCEVGTDVFVLGYPLTQYMGDEIKLTNGIISSKTGYKGDVSTYQISAPVQSGNSGGPMFDNSGNVVGIVNAGIPDADNVGYAIKTAYLYNLVNSVASSAIIPRNNSVVQGTLANKVKQVKKCVFFIKCKGH